MKTFETYTTDDGYVVTKKSWTEIYQDSQKEVTSHGTEGSGPDTGKEDRKTKRVKR